MLIIVCDEIDSEILMNFLWVKIDEVLFLWIENMVEGVIVVIDKVIDIERKVKCVFFGDNGIGKICLFL